MADDNHFFHRGPIKIPTYFFGRQTELNYLTDLLRRGQSVAINGPRRIGKTSLLFHLISPQVSEACGFNPNTTYWVYLDGGALVELDETWLYGAIDRAMQGEADTLTYAQFVARLEDLAAAKKQLIVIIDEFELVASNPHLGLPLFSHLRSLAAQYPIQFVTASKVPLLQLTFAHPDMVSSPFFNIFAPLPLPLLTETEAKDLLNSLSARGGEAFTPDMVDFLLSYVGPHPLFLQVAGYRAFAAISKKKGAWEAKIQALIRKQISADLSPHLTYYWSELGAEARHTLATLPLQAKEGLSLNLERLAEAGLTIQGRYLGEVLETFVRQQEVDGLLQGGPFLMDLQLGVVAAQDQIITLGPHRFAVLKLLLEHPGQVVPFKTIQESLWPEESPGMSDERMRSLIRELRASLGPLGQRIVNRRGQGYLVSLEA